MQSAASILSQYPVLPKTYDFVTQKRKMYIDGEWVGASNGDTRPIIEPSTGEVLASVPEATMEDVDRAVVAARRAFTQGPWSTLKPYDRQQLLLKLADLIEANADAFAQLESLDNGKSVVAAREADVEGAIRFFRYMAGWATKLEGSTKTLSAPGSSMAYTLREPVGVVGAIVPWNFPFSMAAWKVAPALACGCTLVLKPAEFTPLSALLLAELIEQTGFPPGVFNVVTGNGSVAGSALSNHPLVDKIAFTGSTAVGKMVGHAAVENMTRTSLELGGKSPVIVLQDCDVQVAAQGAADAIFFNQGQVCCAGSRLYIHRKIYDQVVTELARIADNIHQAPGLDPACEMGPLVSRQQFEKVSSYIDLGVEEGAELVTGGHNSQGTGYFVKPTVLADTNNSMRVVQEEIFGPVVCAQPFDSIESVINSANDTPYGLGASIWSNNLSQVHQMIPRIQAGVVWVNTHNPVDPCLPFGGFKASGFGREQGREQLEHFLETKSVWLQL
jgi:phenylacetaldehyde dehydrogenase